MVIFSGEEWSEFLKTAASAASPNLILLYVMAALLLGHLVIINLFVAVLVEVFVHDERDRRHKRLLEQRPSPDDGKARLASASASGHAGRDGRSQLVDLEEEEDRQLEGTTCGCLDERAALRVACRHVLRSQLWRGAVLLVIALSCIHLAKDSPEIDPESDLARQLARANVMLTAFFALEAALKICTLGFVAARGAYLRTGWNRLDFLILLTSLLALAGVGGRAGALVRLLRVLRPLRLVRRVPGMTAIFTFFMQAAGEVVNVAGVIVFFQLIFAVIGMQLYMPINFETSVVSFDHFVGAMLLLFASATGDDWSSYMWTAMDGGSAADGAPAARNDRSPAALYFIAWLYVGQWLLINLFIATVVNNFVRIKEEERQGGAKEASASLLSADQRQWQLAMQAAREHQRTQPERQPPPPPPGEARECVWRIVTSTSFDIGMTVVIMLNIGVMSLNYYHIERDPWMLGLYGQLMLLCTNVYYAEAALKIFGLTCEGYFQNGWNRFEFTLVTIALLDQFFADAVRYLPIPPMLLRVLRIARILRILRLLRSFTGLRHVVMTLILSFPSFINVGALLGLVVFMYAVLGVQLFHAVPPGEVLREGHGFQSVLGASQVLFQCLTADRWTRIMLDAGGAGGAGGEGGPGGPGGAAGGPSPSGVVGGLPIAYAYFISFMLLGLFVLANLVVAIILQNFSSLGDFNPHVASHDDIEGFCERWNALDTEGNGFIASEELAALLTSLERPLRPLGILRDSGHANQLNARSVIKRLVDQGVLPQRLVSATYLDYKFVLDTLIRYSFEQYNRAHADSQIEEPRRESLWERVRRRFRDDTTGVLFSVHSSHRRSVGALMQALTAEKLLGSGTTAQQLRSLTELSRAQATKIDSLEAGMAEALQRLRDVEAAMLDQHDAREHPPDGTRAAAYPPDGTRRGDSEFGLDAAFLGQAPPAPQPPSGSQRWPIPPTGTVEPLTAAILPVEYASPQLTPLPSPLPQVSSKPALGAVAALTSVAMATAPHEVAPPPHLAHAVSPQVASPHLELPVRDRQQPLDVERPTHAASTVDVQQCHASTEGRDFEPT